MYKIVHFRDGLRFAVKYLLTKSVYIGNWGLEVLCLTPPLAIFRLYNDSQVFQRWKEENFTDLPQVTDKLYHIMLYRVDLTMSGIRTHNVRRDMHSVHCQLITTTTTRKNNVKFTSRTSLHDHDNEKLFVIHKNIFYLFKGLYYF